LKGSTDIFVEANELPANLGTCLVKAKFVNQEFKIELQNSIDETIEDLLEFHRANNRKEIKVNTLILEHDVLIPISDPMHTFELVMLEKSKSNPFQYLM